MIIIVRSTTFLMSHVLLWLLLCIKIGDAQEESLAPLSALHAFISTQGEALSKMSSVSYSATSVYTVQPSFDKEAGDAAQTRCQYAFIQSGPKWMYDVDITDKAGLFTSEKCAYNGINTQVLEKRSETLRITKSVLKASTLLANKTYLFDPLIFVPKEKVAERNFPLTLQTFTSQGNWKSIIERATKLKMIESAADMLLSFEISGGIDVHTNRQFHYKVVLSKNSKWYPIEIVAIDDAGHMLTDYRVSKIGQIPIGGTGLIFFYPMEAEKKRFVDSGALAGIAKIEITSLQVNQQPVDDPFTLDPSVARLIYDMDAKAMIQVPQ